MITAGLGSVWAQNSTELLGVLRNCEDFKIPEFDEAMTRQERVVILDALLNDLLNRTGGCETAASSSASIGSGSAGGQLRGAARSDALSTEESGNESSGSGQALAGLESEQSESDPGSQEDPVLPESQSTYQAATPDSGKIPQDIPSGDYDDVIAQQIRKAAIAETDPEKQARLWDKYRQYMNLPTKPASHEL